jgi:hypothetical protein
MDNGRNKWTYLIRCYSSHRTTWNDLTSPNSWRFMRAEQMDDYR